METATVKKDAVYLEDIALHEAGHAVIAAYFYVPFSYVCILAKAGQPVIDGSITGKLALDPIGAIKFQLACSPRRNVKGEKVAFRADIPQKIRELGERMIMTVCAGKIAEDVIGLIGKPGRSDNSEDEKNIRERQKSFGISDCRVAQLRKRVGRLIRKPVIRAAILEIRFHLIKAKGGIVKASIVRSIVRRLQTQGRREWELKQ